jgi:hypothetical protein
MTNHRDARFTLMPALLALLIFLIAGANGIEAADTGTLNAVKCAVRSSSTPPPVNAMRILGSQDPTPRSLYDRHDLLLVNAGTGRDLHVDQQFFIRRSAAFGSKQAGPRAVATTGWLRIVAVNETTAIARVEYACRAIHQGDYLDAYVEPVIPAGIDKTDATGEPDFASPAHVLFGDDERHSGGAGDFFVIDRPLEPGSRLAIYRQVALPDLPLTPIGETVVVESDDTTSVVRITRARDYVSSGDLLVPRKKN